MERRVWVLCIVLGAAAAGVHAGPPGRGNRLAYLDERSPFHPGPDFPRLTTPMWFGEEGVEAAVILSIDDLREESVEKYRAFLEPILERLRQVEGRSSFSIFTNTANPGNPQLGRWLEAGVRFDVHTRSHPCPLLAGSLEAATAQVLDCVAGLNRIAGNRPVAFRMPCCDSINSASPRFFSEIFPRATAAGDFLEIDSSVVMFPDDSYAAYAPFRNYAATATGYLHPYTIGRLIWEFPIIAPTDWQAQKRRRPFDPETVADIERGIDRTVAAQGLYTFCFHPHGWIESRQVVEIIDHVVRRHGRKVRFVNFHEALERLNRNLLGGTPLRAPDGAWNGVRLLDLDADGYIDVVAGNDERRESRLWDAGARRWRVADFPFRLVARDPGGAARDTGVRFGVLDSSGRAAALAASEHERGLARFDGERWVLAAGSPLETLAAAGKPVETARGGRDRGARLRDLDGDGLSDLIVNNETQNACWRWDAARAAFDPLPYALPAAGSLVDAGGNDRGLRFLDINADGQDDALLSNDDDYYIYLFTDAARGWSRRALHGPAGSSGALPRITSRGEDRGAWFKDGALHVANEETAGLPDLVEVRRFDRLLDHMAPPPLEPEEALKLFRVPQGFRVELAAAEPLVTSPVAIEFAPDGRLWVTEMGSYPRGEGRDAGGRVKFLRDTDGDGRFDASTLFADGLSFPSGALSFRRGVLVTCAPEILLLEDTDGDGRADRREVVFTGFGTGNHQHRVNGLHRGIDNWIYGANGDSGGDIGAPARPGAPPVPIGGRDFRFRPDLGVFEAATGRTQFGLAFDDFGNRFGTSNVRHLMHAVLPDAYLRRNPHYAAPDPVLDIPDHGAMASIFQVSRQLLSLNDIHVPGHFSSACGVTIYRGDAFPEEYRGSAFVCEPVGNIVHRDVLVRRGVTFRARRGEESSEFLSTTDSWFRPVNTATGPDGALYVVDMHRFVIEHPDYIPRDLHQILDFTAGRDRGRLYRVVHDAGPGAGRRQPAFPDLTGEDGPRLASLLEHPNGWWRDAAQRLLVERQERSVAPALAELAVSGKTAPARLHALWTLDGLGALDAALVARALGDPHPAVREAALRLAEPLLPAASELRAGALAAAEDGDLRVRLQAAFTLGEIDGEDAGAALARILRRNPGDRWIRAAVLSSSLRHAGTLLTALFGDEEPLTDQSGGTAEVLRGLLRVVARRGERREIAALLGRLAAEERIERWHLALLATLVEEGPGEPAAVLEAAAGPGAEKIAAFLARLRARAREAALAAGGDLEERRTAATALGAELARDDSLAALLLSPREPVELQLAAVRVLARAAAASGGAAAPDAAQARLVEAWVGAGPAVRGEILEALLGRPAGAAALLGAVEGGRIAAVEIDAASRERLRGSSDAGVRAAAARLLAPGGEPGREEVVARYRAALAGLRGDEIAGREVFLAHCAPCHRLRGEGFAVGPDLAEARARDDALLVEAILNPSGVVPPRYRPYVLEMRSGELATGLIASETATAVTLARAGGVEESFLRADIRRLAAGARSLMPAELEKAISPQAMADLLAFLRGAPAALDALTPAAIAAARRELAAAGRSGLASVVRAAGRADQASWLGTLPMAFARQLDGTQEVVWLTEPAPAGLAPAARHAFRFPAAMGYASQPRGVFTLRLGERRLLDFDVKLDGAAWRSEDGSAVLHYQARARNAEDTTGLMVLELPAALLEPGKPATLRVTGSAAGSRRWFGLLLPPPQ